MYAPTSKIFVGLAAIGNGGGGKGGLRISRCSPKVFSSSFVYFFNVAVRIVWNEFISSKILIVFFFFFNRA